MLTQELERSLENESFVVACWRDDVEVHDHAQLTREARVLPSL